MTLVDTDDAFAIVGPTRAINGYGGDARGRRKGYDAVSMRDLAETCRLIDDDDLPISRRASVRIDRRYRQPDDL
jgi:hypothetical protein